MYGRRSQRERHDVPGFRLVYASARPTAVLHPEVLDERFIPRRSRPRRLVGGRLLFYLNAHQILLVSTDVHTLHATRPRRAAVARAARDPVLRREHRRGRGQQLSRLWRFTSWLSTSWLMFPATALDVDTFTHFGGSSSVLSHPRGSAANWRRRAF